MEASKPSRCYFSFLDFYSIDHIQRLVGSDAPEIIASGLRAKLKAAVLLYDQVIFRATVVFPAGQKVPYAGNLLAEAEELLAHGALVPEFRAGDEPLAKQLRDHPDRFSLTTRGAKVWLKTAEAIDGAKSKHEPDAVALSKARSAQLIEHLFRQWCFRGEIEILKPKVTLDRLESLFSLLMYPTPPDRKKTILPLVSQLYRTPYHANLLVQNIYFGMGALRAESDLFLPDGLLLPETMRTYPQLEEQKLSHKAHKLADKYGIGQNVPSSSESYMVLADDVLAEIELVDTMLEALSWNDILDLRKSGVWKKAHKKIFKIRTRSRNVMEWNQQIRDEMRREHQRSTWASNVQTALSLIGLFPVVSQFFSALSLGIDLVERCPIVKAAFMPLTAFGDKVRQVKRREIGNAF